MHLFRASNGCTNDRPFDTHWAPIILDEILLLLLLRLFLKEICSMYMILLKLDALWAVNGRPFDAHSSTIWRSFHAQNLQQQHIWRARLIYPHSFKIRNAKIVVCSWLINSVID